MESHRGSESDDGDGRSGSPGSQGEENDERQAMLNQNGGGTSSNKMTRFLDKFNKGIFQLHVKQRLQNT